MKRHVHAIGLTAGNGYIKAASGDKTIVFPAVAAPYLQYEENVQTVVIGGTHWLVGDDALTYARSRIVAHQDKDRYKSDAFVAMLRYAIQSVARDSTDLSLVAGMPLFWYQDSSNRGILEHAIRQAIAPVSNIRISIVPEATGIYYQYAFENPQDLPRRIEGEIGVIDIGWRDVNIMWFSNGKPAGGESIAGGIRIGLLDVQRRLGQEPYCLELNLHETDRVLRSGGVWVNGEYYAFGREMYDRLHVNLETAISVAQNKFPNQGRTLRLLLVGGGGAYAWYQSLVEIWPQAVMVKDPQLAGAIGFRFLAEQQEL